MFTKKRAYTIVELLITFSLFIIIAMISVVVLNNTLKSSKKIRAQIFLYTETQALMDILSNNIQSNTVDYEGYYLRNVLGESGWGANNFGAYGMSFVHPGSGGPVGLGPYAGISGYGTFCSDGSSTYPDDCPGSIPLATSLDSDMGAHPFTGITAVNGTYIDDSTFMNAFCQSADGSGNCDSLANYRQDELMLINGEGDERIVIVREQRSAGSSDFRLSKVVMRGTDTNSDGIEDDWNCSLDYTCGGADGGPDPADLTNTDSPPQDFVPISPSAIHVKEFYIFVSPLEDPYKAYAESDFDVQQHPQVTIIMTTTLSDSATGGFIGNNPEITVQRTVSTGVFTEVPSYE